MEVARLDVPQSTVCVAPKLDIDSTCVLNCRQLTIQVSVCNHPSPSMRCWVICKIKIRLLARIARHESPAWTDITLCSVGNLSILLFSHYPHYQALVNNINHANVPNQHQ